MAAVSLIREGTVVIFEETGGWILLKLILYIKKSIKMNLSQNSTPSKTFCDGLDFGRLQDSRHYAYCFLSNAIDFEE